MRRLHSEGKSFPDVLKNHSRNRLTETFVDILGKNVSTGKKDRSILPSALFR